MLGWLKTSNKTWGYDKGFYIRQLINDWWILTTKAWDPVFLPLFGKQRSNDKQCYGTVNIPFTSNHDVVLTSLQMGSLRTQLSWNLKYQVCQQDTQAYTSSTILPRKLASTTSKWKLSIFTDISNIQKDIFSYLRSILKLTPDGRLKMEALNEGVCPEFQKELKES